MPRRSCSMQDKQTLIDTFNEKYTKWLNHLKSQWFSNLLENEFITQKKPCVAEEMTYNLLVPSIYVSNKENQHQHVLFSIKTGWKVVWQKCTDVGKFAFFNIPSYVNYYAYLMGIFAKRYPRSGWSWVLTLLRTKWWRYLHCKYHVWAIKWCDKNVLCLVWVGLTQGLHCLTLLAIV